MENFDIFIQGIGAVVAAIVVFCGSIWLLLTMVLGARLAYFVTASVTLGFLLIMGIVWSFTDLGPVGELPTWKASSVVDDPAKIDFGPAQDYPEGPWKEADPNDEAQVTQASELEATATEEMEAAIEAGDITNFDDADSGAVDSGKTRMLEQSGKLYGIATIEATPEAEAAGTGEGQVVVLAQYDFGNVYGPARMITGATFVILALHIYGLSRAEAKAKRIVEAAKEAGRA